MTTESKLMPAVATTSTALVVMGVSGCGKSTLAEALAARMGAVLVEGDAHHPAGSIAKLSSGVPLDDVDRWPWLDSIAHQIRKERESGKLVIATCSALKKSYRDRLRSTVGPGLTFLFLRLGQSQLKTRLAARQGHFMSRALLASQLSTLEDPRAEPDVIEIDGSLPTQQQIGRFELWREREGGV